MWSVCKQLRLYPVDRSGCRQRRLMRRESVTSLPGFGLSSCWKTAFGKCFALSCSAYCCRDGVSEHWIVAHRQ